MSNNYDNRSKLVIKNTVFLFLRMFLVTVVGLYTSRVVLSVLGVEDYGIYNLVGSVVILFSFLQSALNNATYRYLAYGLGKGDIVRMREIFSMAVNVHVLLALLILLLSEIFGLWFLTNKLAIPENRIDSAVVAFHFSIAVFCAGIIKTPFNSLFIAHEQMFFYAYTSIVEIFFKLVIVYLLVIFDADKLVLYSQLLFITSLLMLVWYILRCHKYFVESHYKKGWNRRMFCEMLNYSWWSVIVNASDVIVNQSVIFYFNVFFGVTANAAIGIANTINSHLNNFIGNFTQSYNPQIIKSYAEGDLDYFMQLIFSSGKFSYYLMLFLAVPICINIDFILQTWLVIPPEGSSTFVIYVIIFSLIDAYSAPLWIGVHATGKLRTHQLIMSCIKLLNIPLAYIMLKTGLPAWSVLALKASINFVCSIVRPCYVKRLYGLPLKQYFIHVLLLLILVTVIVVIVPILLTFVITTPWIKLLTSSLAFYAIFIPVIYYWGLNVKERLLVNSILQKKKL